MKTRLFIPVVFASLSCIRSSTTTTIGTKHHSGRAMLETREIIDENDLSDVYDYVVAGGGLAGLVLASRLSESNTVLVLEAGLSGDDIADRVNTPSGAYYASIVGTAYDWAHVTVPQVNLSNRFIAWPKGKILGGSTAMNAMYLVRPSHGEINAWQQLIASDDNDAATRWGWIEMYDAMRKSENFTPPINSVGQVGNIRWDASTHGNSGPMSVSYPGIMMSLVGNWTSSLNAIGIPTLPNPNGGNTLGGFVAPSSINPTNWTRSYSRPAYIDSLPPRSNLHILPGATVTRVRFLQKPTLNGWVANQVDFAKDSNSRGREVGVRREVILTAGSVGSPAILMHSGFGPREMLENVGVDVMEDLPGVGQHLQDHLTAGVVWQSHAETAGDIHKSNSNFAQSPEFLSYINDAVAYVNMSTLFGPNDTSCFRQKIQDAADSSAFIIPSSDPSVMEGYTVIYNLLVNEFYNNEAQLELLMALTSPGTVSIQAAIQHPFSQGRLYINSSDPFQPAVIDPQYYSHFADITIMRQGIKLVRQLGAALGSVLGAEVIPGNGVQTDEQIETWLRDSAANSQFHPACSCGMLPRTQGGCVDSKLRVYGAGTFVKRRLTSGHSSPHKLFCLPIVAFRN